jgi:alanyl-tRNA synthetase
LFGEKYGERVRVITFDPDYSVELCGGIHVDRTGELGLLKFVSEGSVAAGIRRIEAVSGRAALGFVHRELEELRQVRGQFRSLQRPSHEEVADLISEHKRLEKDLAGARMAALSAELERILANATMVGDIRIAVGRLEGADAGTLRDLAEKLRGRAGEKTVGILGSADTEAGKVYLAASVSGDLVAGGKVAAGKLVGVLARDLDGGGGGRPELATAGGKSPEKLPGVLASAPKIVSEMLG